MSPITILPASSITPDMKTFTSDPVIEDLSQWPQKPLLLTPTPNYGMKIKGVRYSSGTEYLPWKSQHLPVNTGFEESGKSVVIDFSSKAFEGTMLIRAKNIPGVRECSGRNNKKSYFQGRKRNFQTIIQGSFKDEYPMSSSVTGQLFRPTSKSPSSFVFNSAIKFFKILSPQLDVQWNESRIKFLSPLNSTAHSIHVSDFDEKPENLQALLENWELAEPSSDHKNSIFSHHSIPQLSKDSNLTRKQVFDKLFAHNKSSNINSMNSLPQFETNKVYTFQFYQHLIHLDEFKLEVLGTKWSLSKYLGGQPIKIYSGCGSEDNTETAFWSFDLFHESQL